MSICHHSAHVWANLGRRAEAAGSGRKAEPASTAHREGIPEVRLSATDPPRSSASGRLLRRGSILEHTVRGLQVDWQWLLRHEDGSSVGFAARAEVEVQNAEQVPRRSSTRRNWRVDAQ